jgi:hypothetical protein
MPLRLGVVVSVVPSQSVLIVMNSNHEFLTRQQESTLSFEIPALRPLRVVFELMRTKHLSWPLQSVDVWPSYEDDKLGVDLEA